MTLSLKTYLKATLLMSCLFKLFVLCFCFTVSSVETLLIFSILLFLVYRGYIFKKLTLAIWSFISTIFLLSISLKFSLYIDYGDFDYLLATPTSISQYFVELFFSEVSSVRDSTVVTKGNVTIIDQSVHVSRPLDRQLTVVEHWKNGEYRPGAIWASEGLVKVMGAGVTTQAALTIMGKTKFVIKATSIGVASLTAVGTVTEAFTK